MVFTLIRATRKTTLNCFLALSVCLVHNVYCTRSQQLRTMCSCVTESICLRHIADANNFSNIMGLVCYNLCLRKACDSTIRHTMKRYYRLQQLELRFVLQMYKCNGVLLITLELNIVKQPFNALK